MFVNMRDVFVQLVCGYMWFSFAKFPNCNKFHSEPSVGIKHISKILSYGHLFL